MANSHISNIYIYIYIYTYIYIYICISPGISCRATWPLWASQRDMAGAGRLVVIRRHGDGRLGLCFDRGLERPFRWEHFAEIIKNMYWDIHINNVYEYVWLNFGFEWLAMCDNAGCYSTNISWCPVTLAAKPLKQTWGNIYIYIYIHICVLYWLSLFIACFYTYIGV